MRYTLKFTAAVAALCAAQWSGVAHAQPWGNTYRPTPPRIVTPSNKPPAVNGMSRQQPQRVTFDRPAGFVAQRPAASDLAAVLRRVGGPPTGGPFSNLPGAATGGAFSADVRYADGRGGVLRGGVTSYEPGRFGAGGRYTVPNPPGPGGGRTSTTYGGFLSNGPGGFAAGGRYSDGRGTAADGFLTYRSPQDFSTGLGYTTPNPRRNGEPPTSSILQGGISNGRGGFAAGGQYSDGRGTSLGGNLAYRDPRNASVGVNYGQYRGSVSRQDGVVRVGAGFSTPGAIPGTRMNYDGGVTFRGRDSTATGGATVTDPTGLVRFGGGTGALDRRGYTQRSDVGLGGVRATQTDDVRFRGINSSYTQTRQATVPGLGRASSNYSVSRQGVSGGQSVSVGGARIGVNGSVSSRGVNIRPEISVPRPSLPSLPKVTTPSLSKPSVRIGGVRF
jgi:hypothetical protein